MTTSAPQWPGQEGTQQQDEIRKQRPAHAAAGRGDADADTPAAGGRNWNGAAAAASSGPASGSEGRSAAAAPAGGGSAQPVRGRAGPGGADSRAARRRARANLPSPAAVTREIALALLEVEAGCRSVSQLERVVSRELWEELNRASADGVARFPWPVGHVRTLPGGHARSGGYVAVVRKGELVRPVALRLDAGGGRWVVTEPAGGVTRPTRPRHPAEMTDIHDELDRDPRRRQDRLTGTVVEDRRATRVPEHGGADPGSTVRGSRWPGWRRATGRAAAVERRQAPPRHDHPRRPGAHRPRPRRRRRPARPRPGRATASRG